MIKNSSIAAALLIAVASSAAVAQGSSDAGGVGGAGSAVGSAMAPVGLPGNVSAGGPQYAASQATTANARAAFLNATGAVPVSSPAGGTVSMSQSDARALGALLQGGGSSPAVEAAFGGTPQGAALARALSTMGSDPYNVNVNNAIVAYNAAIVALPAGATPSPMMLAARQTLVQITAARAAAAGR